jgi:cytidylate kinase
MMKTFISPVIAIDGPSGSGKGAVAQRAAKELSFHYLDSGAIYRVAALAALRANVSLTDEARLALLAEQLDFGFYDEGVYLEGKDVSLEVRGEATGNAASTIAALPGLRVALLDRQRAFRQPPGLVADGRDMGSVVFPDAVLKIFLTASVETRAERRYKQLIEKGMAR